MQFLDAFLSSLRWCHTLGYEQGQDIAVHHGDITSRYSSSLMTPSSDGVSFVLLLCYLSVLLAVQVKSVNQNIDSSESVYKWKASN